MKGKDILSSEDFTKDEILTVLKKAKKLKKKGPHSVLKGKVMASLFFEPSTRTRLSFEAAMKKLGGSVIGLTEADQSSLKKGESLHDTIRVIGGYVDVIVLRHPEAGSAKVASDATHKPVINAGDGPNEHPTQTLLDLFTIQELFGTLDGLKLAFVGDLKHARTVHSLAKALKFFNNQLFFVAPPSLQLPEKIASSLNEANVSFSLHEKIEDVIGKVDVIYIVRIQQERFKDRAEYETVKDVFRLNGDIVGKGKKGLKIFSPLPRLTEIDTALDAMPQAAYFEQAENGLYVRQALLTMIL